MSFGYMGRLLSVLKGRLLLVLSIILNRGILVLLILSDKILHVALSLGELHLVHAFLSVPVGTPSS